MARAKGAQVAAEKRELEKDISLVRAPDALLRAAAEGDRVLVPVEEAPAATEDAMVG